MSQSIDGTVRVSWESSYREYGTPRLADLLDKLTLSTSWAFQYGTAADQATNHWHDQRTLAASTSELIDLQDLTHPFGFDMKFNIIRYLFVKLVTTGQTDFSLEVGVDLDAAHPWRQWLQAPVGASGVIAMNVRSGNVKQGGGLLWVAPDDTGYTVTATAKNMYIKNTATSAATYNIAIGGDGESLG